MTLLCAALLLCGGCGAETRYSITYTDVFDTATVLTAYTRSRAEFTALAEAVHEELALCHRLFDIYHEYPDTVNLCTLNRLAGTGPVAVDTRILDLLQLSISLYDATGGKLNVAMGSVLTLWHDEREAADLDPASASPPAYAALQDAAAHMDIHSILLDPAAGTVALLDPAVRLDVGAVGKGWAAGRACDAARALGYTDFILSAGGNVCAVGGKPGGEAWSVGLEDPSSPGASLRLLALRDRCAVTSGAYQRYFMADGKRYSHLIDPDTLYPASQFEMVTVLAPDSGLADALSTALFLLPLEEGRALAAAYPDVEVFWLYPSGESAQTADFARYIQK